MIALNWIQTNYLSKLIINQTNDDTRCSQNINMLPAFKDGKLFLILFTNPTVFLTNSSQPSVGNKLENEGFEVENDVFITPCLKIITNYILLKWN